MIFSPKVCLELVFEVLFTDSCFFSDWRNEGERRHQETLDAVRATAREQVPFNIQMVSVSVLHSSLTHRDRCSILMNSVKHSRLKSECSLEKLASFVKNAVTSNSKFFLRSRGALVSISASSSELGYLMMMKAKYGPGGEFDPEW